MCVRMRNNCYGDDAKNLSTPIFVRSLKDRNDRIMTPQVNFRACSNAVQHWCNKHDVLISCFFQTQN